MFAAGHARGKDRDLFVAQLLENPTIKRIHEGKRRLSVKRQPEVFVAATTAVCCLETVDNLDRMLLEKLHSLAGKLFPPNNFLQARLLAPAGASDPKLLKGHQKRGSAIVAACIRAASMIATEHMLDVIESYATVRGEIIDDEIARAFHVFDPDKFMRRVIVPRLETYGIKLQSELVAEAKSLFLLDADTRLGPRILRRCGRVFVKQKLNACRRSIRPCVPADNCGYPREVTLAESTRFAGRDEFQFIAVSSGTR